MRKAILFIDICRMCTGVFLFQWVNKWVNFHGHNIDCILNFVSISVKVESPFQLQCFWWVFINYPFIPNSIARKNMRCVSVRCKSTLLRLFSSTGYESRTLYVSVNVSNLNSFHSLWFQRDGGWELRNLLYITYQKGKLQAVIVKQNIPIATSNWCSSLSRALITEYKFSEWPVIFLDPFRGSPIE